MSSVRWASDGWMLLRSTAADGRVLLLLCSAISTAVFDSSCGCVDTELRFVFTLTFADGDGDRSNESVALMSCSAPLPLVVSVPRLRVRESEAGCVERGCLSSCCFFFFGLSVGMTTDGATARGTDKLGSSERGVGVTIRAEFSATWCW